jgi:cysteinyl-tRNA synthetase
MLPIAVIIVFVSFQIVIIDGWSFKGQNKNNILLFNTISRYKEKFEAISEPKVTFYSCGPTVYDYAHIGNFRAFITYDLLKRWLEYSGYDVEHICNLTDIGK